MQTIAINILKKLTALCCAVVLLFPLTAMAKELKQIQQRIYQQEQKIAERKREQNRLRSALQSQENEINILVDILQKTELSLKEIGKIMIDIQRQIEYLEQQETKQKKQLAQQLDAIYRAGNSNSMLEHLLSEKAKNADRMMGYVKHINQSRLALIEQLKVTQQQLQQQKSYLFTHQLEQQNQLVQQKKQQQDLQKMRQQRQTTLNKLNQSLQLDQTKLEQLKANEIALRNEIERAVKLAKQQEKQRVDLGKGLNGKYSFPVSGKILHSFGSAQVGELKWKGIVINANLGSDVKAIAGGRVILASWLAGYGQLVVIDHGEGYMSLYGYNRVLSVKAGSLVKAGQKIAEVGDSGEQNRPALYFEIRHQGNVVNPMKWLG